MALTNELKAAQVISGKSVYVFPVGTAETQGRYVKVHNISPRKAADFDTSTEQLSCIRVWTVRSKKEKHKTKMYTSDNK